MTEERGASWQVILLVQSSKYQGTRPGQNSNPLQINFREDLLQLKLLGNFRDTVTQFKTWKCYLQFG